MQKTSMGLDENIAGLLCYVLGWITGIIFLIIEPGNKFVRFHAVQSIIVFGIYTVITAILGWIPFVGGFFVWALSTIAFILWVVLMVKAYQGVIYKLPKAGDIAERFAGN
jgi:uncharacterized membrane protein